MSGIPRLALLPLVALLAGTSLVASAEAKEEPREIQIHDLEGHWYLLKLSVDEFKSEAAADPPTDYDRHELYKAGLDLRALCREQLEGTRQLLEQKAPVEDEFWYRSRLQVLRKSLRAALSDIELILQQLEPGPILP